MSFCLRPNVCKKCGKPLTMFEGWTCLECEKVEQEPCDDAISLERAKKQIGRWIGYIDQDMINRICMSLDALPIVTQKSTECDDAISREAVEECKELMTDINGDTVYAVRMSDIRQLPSVTQKSGKWICIDDYHIGKFKCSVCQTEGFPNTVMYKPTWNFCPNCGAKMESEE